MFNKLLAGITAGLMLLCTLSFNAQAAGYTQTRYQIVLVHGLFGFDSIAGIPYFYDIPDGLASGGARVFLAQVSATNSNEVRGEQLLSQVRQVLAITGATRVNLIGHSQGGLTARYVAAVRPDLVASVTSVGTPHKGSRVADLVRNVLPPGSVSESVARDVIQGVAVLIDEISGGNLPQNPLAALDALTTPGTRTFNTRYPAGLPTTACGSGAARVNNVAYYSWGGIANYTNFYDVSDVILGATGLVFGDEDNDGLVGRCSNHLGTIIYDDYFQNHLDEVDQVFGLVSPFTSNPVTLFRAQANRLRNAGY